MSRFKDATSATLIAPLEPFARRCRLACKLLMPHYKGPSSTAFSSQSAKVNDFFILSQKGRRRPWRQTGGVFIAPISQSASSRAWRISGHGRRKRERERERPFAGCYVSCTFIGPFDCRSHYIDRSVWET